MATSTIKKDIKTRIISYNISSDGTSYYSRISNILPSIGTDAHKVVSVTMHSWAGDIANHNPISYAYNSNSDAIDVLFVPHTFSNKPVEFLIAYE